MGGERCSQTCVPVPEECTNIKTCVTDRKSLRLRLINITIFHHQSPAGKKHTREDPSQSCCCCCWPPTGASTAQLWGNSAAPGTKLQLSSRAAVFKTGFTILEWVSFQVTKNHSSTSPVHSCCVLCFHSVFPAHQCNEFL